MHTEEKKKRTKKMNLRGRTERLKFIDIVAYHFELAYNLYIAKIDNVSVNPGFESYLRVWGISYK